MNAYMLEPPGNASLAGVGRYTCGVARRPLCRLKEQGPPKAPKGALAVPLSGFSKAYFGTGSDPKLAWTMIHLLSFFTKMRVDFARLGVVLPSLSMVVPA